MARKKNTQNRPSKRAETPDVESPAMEATRDPEGEGVSRTASLDPYLGVAYSISTWKGLPNHECRFCAMATLDRADAIQHFEKEHCTQKPEERIVDTGLIDEDGSKIVRVIPAEEV